MVDVDDFAAEFLAEPVWEDLHEAGEDGEFYFLFNEEFADLLEAVGFFVAIHVDVVEGDAGFFCDGLAGVTVADDGGDFDGHFS